MSPFLGEFIGTMLMVFLGNGVVANVLLHKSKGQNAGWMVIASGWAFAVMVGVFAAIAFGSPDAHLNPAVTVWDAIVHGNTAKLAIYIPAQFLGAFVGAILVWLHYLPHWKETTDPGLKLACFSTGPAIRHVPGNLISEILGTAVLLIGIGAIFSTAVAGQGLAGGLPPYLVAALVWGIGLSLGGSTGYAIIPPATSPHEWRMLSCPSPAKAVPIGVTRGFRWSVPSSARSSPRCSSNSSSDPPSSHEFPSPISSPSPCRTRPPGPRRPIPQPAAALRDPR